MARDSTLRTEPAQSQSLKSPSTTVVTGVSPIRSSSARGLAAALAEAQAQMGGDDAQRAGRRIDLAADGAARLALQIGNVADLAIAHRPAADQHLAVLAVGGGDRLRADAVIAERLLQHLERVAAFAGRAGSRSPAARRYRAHGAGSVRPRAPGRSAGCGRARRGCSRSSPGPWPQDARSPSATPKPAPRATRRASRSPQAPAATPPAATAALTIATMRWPSADITIRPGSMPSIVPARIIDELDRAGAEREIDERERRDRHHAHRGDRQHALPRDARADAVEPRSDQAAQRVLTELRADPIDRQRARQHAERRIEKAEPRAERRRGRGDQDGDRKRDQSADDETCRPPAPAPKAPARQLRARPAPARVGPFGQRRDVPGERQNGAGTAPPARPSRARHRRRRRSGRAACGPGRKTGTARSDRPASRCRPPATSSSGSPSSIGRRL